MLQELISNRKGLWLGVEKHNGPDQLEVTFRVKNNRPCVLHWGTAIREAAPWQAPAESLWPEGSTRHGTSAVQTPFQPDSEGGHLVLRFPAGNLPPFLVFDLFSPETNRWENNRGKDFWIGLGEAARSPSAALHAALESCSNLTCLSSKTVPLAAGGELAVAVLRDDECTQVRLAADVAGPLLLHWGVQRRPRATWELPETPQRPAESSPFDERALRTPFIEREGLQWLTLTFATGHEPPGIGLVLYQPETARWIKTQGGDFFLNIAPADEDETALSTLMEEIVEAETGDHGWTLMHRFNLCHDLIDEAGEDPDAWDTLFVWMRYSAIRQLDWQRNYNTKPRELSHAQDRLTAKLAAAFVSRPNARDSIRSILACVGRGGDGQRIRDDILHIMHRHHIKEVGGTWMEQWHQKLHNNTTPDDVVICQAYLAFLRGDGDLAAYDATLLDGGVTRDRLKSFERPITQNPEWHPHLKDGLIHDFEAYLTLLQSVHSGTDLHVAADAGAYLLHGSPREALGFVQWSFRNPNTDAVELTGRITEVRQALVHLLANESNADRVKDGLYLDLALEEALRTAIERQFQARFGQNQLLTLIDQVLVNLGLSLADPELQQCNREWRRLPVADRFAPDWCLHAHAAVNRTRRAVESITDGTYQRLQPKAEQLGKEFGAATWTVTLFSEEVVRGRPVFLLSMLLHTLDPILRKGAKLGDWQVVSPSTAGGYVEVVNDLRSLQGKVFDRPTVMIADVVHGDEEPPEGVRAVLTSRSVDLVSHVAVRARNSNLLFATCFDEAAFERLKALKGQHVQLRISPGGDVQLIEGTADSGGPAHRPKRTPQRTNLPEPSLRVLAQSEFEPHLVGGKSWRLREMARTIPNAFRTPRSLALPYRVFDAVLAQPANRKAAHQFVTLLAQAAKTPETTLPTLRDCIRSLQVPEQLLEHLARGMEQEGLGRLEEADVAADRIKHVWASLWNDRAYFSRRTNGLPHDGVSMAVLIQEVVNAEYAFVIHTTNPATQSPDEIYAEIVCGLGETLVGNHPGRALSVAIRKDTFESTLLAYPAKSIGLYGGGLIFRSDSNAEDLEGYAGAGLYDSVLLSAAVERRLDYTSERLVWDEEFQKRLFTGLAKLAVEVERAFGGPQDIEGAWAGDLFHVVQTRPQVGL